MTLKNIHLTRAAYALLALAYVAGVGGFAYIRSCTGWCRENEVGFILVLFLILPILGSFVASFTVYLAKRLSMWTYPMIAWSMVPLAALLNLALSIPFVDVAPAAQNTQGVAAAGLLTIVAVVFFLVSFGFVALPLMASVSVWAEREIKKYFIVSGASLVVILLLISGVFGSIITSFLEYMN